MIAHVEGKVRAAICAELVNRYSAELNNSKALCFNDITPTVLQTCYSMV